MKAIDENGQEIFLSNGAIYLCSNLEFQKDELLRRLTETNEVWALSRTVTSGRCGKVMQTHAERFRITGTADESYIKLTEYYGVFIPN